MTDSTANNAAQLPQDNGIASARKGLVSRSLVSKFIVVFSILAITAVVIAFHDKDPIAERKAAEEEKRQQQQVSQAPGNPAELARIFSAQTEAGKAAREAAPKRSDSALEALAKGTQQGTAPLDVSGALMPNSSGERTEAYRQKRDAVAAVNLPIYLDDREPRKGEGAPASGALRTSQISPGLAAARESAPNAQGAQLDALYRSLAGGGQGSKPFPNPANEEWLHKVEHAGEQGPVFAQQALFPQHTLRRGAIIPAVTVRGLNSDLPGQLTVQVTQDVYDSATGENLLIPKGTRLVGPYNADVGENQERLFAAFQQLLYQNGATVNLPGMPASDLAGYSGLAGEKNSHFWRIFGSSFLVAGIARLLAPKNQSNNTVVINAGTGLTDTAGQVLVETTRRILDRNQGIRPTITVGHGEKMNVEVTRDLVLPPEITGMGRPAQ